MNLDIIAGARPNFMKIAPIIHAIEKHNKENGKKINYRLIHTGQHYDKKLSESFFEQLNIPQPHHNLNVGSGTQAEQTGNIMIRYEEVLLTKPADVVLVVGDVTSTMACSIVAKKLNLQVVHVEAGIRSFDLTMPEEINRLVTDAITDHFFTTSEVANENLRKAGVADERIHFVGNTMIDTLFANLDKLSKPDFWDALNLQPKEYIVLTLHRPANVDEEEKLIAYLEEINRCAGNFPVIFPVHPRTASKLKEAKIQAPNIHFTESQGYHQFIYLVKNAKAVLTDSGGIQEETTVLGVPCATLRDNTERPETVSVGTNELIGTSKDAIKPAFDKLNSGNWKRGAIPERWDGKTAERIVSALESLI
jgi:UDP-N-acetylglucosamine 2-epimerase (non-hydrolysing)